MKSGLVLGAALLATVAGFGCGPNLTATPAPSTGPSTISPLLAPRISGLWGGTLTLTGIAGGTGPARSAGALQCAGREFSNVIGESTDHTLSISQDPASVTAITGRLASGGTGLACSYSGHIGVNKGLSLAADTCAAPVLFLRCSEIINDQLFEEVVQMELVGSSITGTYEGDVNITAIRGTAAHTYNLRSADGDPLGGLIANHTIPGLVRR
jgi:hypothetical protein